MDEFIRQTVRTIGPDGYRCPRCNPFRRCGRKVPGLDQLRRSRLRRELVEVVRVGVEMRMEFKLNEAEVA